MDTHAVLYSSRYTGRLIERTTEPTTAADAIRWAHELCRGGYARVVLVDRAVTVATSRFDSATVHA